MGHRMELYVPSQEVAESIILISQGLGVEAQVIGAWSPVQCSGSREEEIVVLPYIPVHACTCVLTNKTRQETVSNPCVHVCVLMNGTGRVESSASSGGRKQVTIQSAHGTFTYN